MVEVADGEEEDPQARIGSTTVHQHEQRDKFIVGLARDRIHHASSMLDRDEAPPW